MAGYDIPLLFFAILLCGCSCAGATTLLTLARDSTPRLQRNIYLLAGACLGGGAWATFFLAILSYQPVVMITFDATRTLLSGAIGIAGAAGAFWLYWRNFGRNFRVLAGIVAAFSVCALYLVGVLAIDASAHMSWDWRQIGLSFVVCLLGCGSAFYVMDRTESIVSRLLASAFFSLAILSVHIPGVAAVHLHLDSSLPPPEGVAPGGLALIITIVSVILLAAAIAYVIADRRVAFARLSAEQKASKLADAALEGLIVHDGQSVIEANTRFSWIAGDGTESVQGRPLSDFFDEEAVEAIRKTIQEQSEGAFETKLAGADADVELYTRVYDSQAGQYVTAVRDLSMRKRINSAEAANLAKSQFLANMSHELRTPLNAIIGYSEMIIEDSDDAEAVRDATEINVAAKGMQALVNDILDLSRIEDGKVDFCFDVCDAEELANRLNKKFSPLAAERGLQFEIHVGEGANAAIVDEQRIEQCVSQLLSNAFKFTEHGRVMLRFDMREEDFRAVVADTGIGMRPERAAQLFEAFQQGDGSISRRYGGVGVGLALTSRLVSLMGGHLELETAEGVGSIFTLVAPSDPDPDLLALRRREGAGDRAIRIVDASMRMSA